MCRLLTCVVLAISSSAFAQNQDIFVDDQEQEQQQEQQSGGYPDGYPQPTGCNPPCPAGQTCAHGACQPAAGVQVVVHAQPQPQPQPQPLAAPVHDPRYASKARRRGIIGFVGVGLVLGLGLSSAATSSNNDQIPSLPLGVATIAVHLLTGILASGGARAARRAGGRGITGLRIAGWVTWALAMAGGVGLAILGASDVDVDAGPIIGVTALSAVSLLSFGIDAIVGAQQARAASQAQQALFRPILYAAPDIEGGMNGLFGVNATW